MVASEKHIDTDILVIGSGVAGLSFALKSASLGDIIVITKTEIDDGATKLAQGGIASVQSPDDSIELHVQDTLKAGWNLSKEEVVRKVVEYGIDAAKELLKIGVPLDIDPQSLDKLAVSIEGGHSRKRILHVADATGKSIQECYSREVLQNPRIRVLPYHIAIDLLTQHQLPKKHPLKNEPTKCFGVYALDEKSGFVRTIRAKITLLASGGAGRVYVHTTNPAVATGDGVAMAYRAGATISNMEFFQFHPTMFYDPGGDGFLITEAVRGEGGTLLNSKGERFMERVHPKMELAPRDILARAIDEQLKKTGEQCVFIDLRSKGSYFIQQRFPNIYRHCLERGVDITKELIPVVPAAHYLCGGIKVDLNAKTDIRNLLSAGETACTGMHGANRLASNSLLESMAFAEFAFQSAKEILKEKQELPDLPDWNDSGVFDRQEWVIVRHIHDEIRRLMWDYVGIVRSDDRLETARRLISYLMNEIDVFYRANPVRRDVIELRNLALVSMLIIRSAQRRPESRGLHYNSDHPEMDPRYDRDTDLKEQITRNETHISESVIGTA